MFILRFFAVYEILQLIEGHVVIEAPINRKKYCKHWDIAENPENYVSKHLKKVIFYLSP